MANYQGDGKRNVPESYEEDEKEIPQMIVNRTFNEYLESELRLLGANVEQDDTMAKKNRKQSSKKIKSAKARRGRKDPTWKLNVKNVVSAEDSDATTSQCTSTSCSTNHTVEFVAENACEVNISNRVSISPLDGISVGSEYFQIEEVANLSETIELLPPISRKVHRNDRNPGNHTIWHEGDMNPQQHDVSSSSTVNDIHATDYNDESLSKQARAKIGELKFKSDVSIIKLEAQKSAQRYSMNAKKAELEKSIAKLRDEFNTSINKDIKKIAEIKTKIKMVKATTAIEINRIRFN